MLAKAPPNPSPSLVFSFFSFSVPEPFSDSRTPLHFHLRYPLNSPGKWKKLPAYKRIPMENAGAYQLIDEATGDKFIVWGGSDDSPIPSERVLSWKPDSSIAAPKLKSSPSSSSSAKSLDKSPAERRVRLGHGFGRLKVQQVRELIKRSPRTAKQEFAPSPSAAHDDCDTRGQPLDFIAARRIRTSAQLNLEETRAKDVKSTGNAVNATVNNSTNSSPRHASSLLRGWAAVGSSEEMKRPRTRTPADVGFFSRKSFRDLGCTDAMVEALRRLQFLRPSHIQAMAYEPILRGKSCVIADQSGSGKTLAYLAPTVQQLRQEELLGIARSLPKSPRVVILVPTAELASQVLNSCRSIAKVGVPFRSMVVTGGFRQRTQLDNLQQELDVVIATPGRFMYLLQEGFLQMIHLRCIILDEVDILFGDKGFEQVLQTLISTAPVEAQYLFVTATLPVDIYNKLVEIFPDCEVIMGPGMHRISSRLEEVLVDCSGSVEEEKTQERAYQNKKSALVQLAEQFPVPRTIIFCNKIETCRKVENVLKRFDRKGGRIKALPFHAALDQELRLLNMKEFLDTKLTESSFLICTDRVSRGIDFTNVDHVVLFDFPRDPSEYVRRVGRTARGAGSKGKAFVFVVGKQVSLARRIMERNKKGHPLHHVPSVMESGFL